MEHFEKYDITNQSTPEEIKKVFNKLTLIYHPDRKSGDIKIFTEIKEVYEDLIEQKETKNHKKEQRNKIFNQVEAFKAIYQNSKDERNDIIKYYKKYKGSVPKIIQNLFCASYEDEDRIRKIIVKLIEEGKLKELKKHNDKISKSKIKRAQKEAKEVEKILEDEKEDEKNEGDLYEKYLEDISEKYKNIEDE